jgi:hypothetical protein
MNEEIEYKGGKIVIETDADPTNPRIDCDYLGTMACFHDRYRLGDCGDRRPARELYGKHYPCFHYLSDVEEFIEQQKAIALPLYLYDHSGITMSTAPFYCHWDSSLVGYIYVTRARVLQEYGGRILTKKIKSKVQEVLEAEVETYDQYLSGDVYGFTATSPEGEEVGSCWGFYGDDHEASGLLDHARCDIDGWFSQRICSDASAHAAELAEKL